MRNLLKELLQCTDKELENQLKAWDAKSLREFLVISISQQDRQTKCACINSLDPLKFANLFVKMISREINNCKKGIE